jgi:UDP-N-acetylmuramoyl-L-alanyl-D-glutamate--2,6-diaminopimelate ligase
MIKLSELLSESALKATTGSLDIAVGGIVFDSRKMAPGCVFVAIRGRQSDGHSFIGKAVEEGAAAVVAQQAPPASWGGQAVWVEVEDSARTLGEMAAVFYGHPSRSLKLVGITGTNGKTTVATLLYQLFSKLGYRTGLISTVENRILGEVQPSAYTTPDAVSLQALLGQMRDAGCEYAFMEVSSHAVDQERIAGLAFAGGVFTNMSHDHLDYHGTFQAYIEAKKKFFDRLPKDAFALVNTDDKRGPVMVQNTAARIYRYSLRSLADFKGRIIDNSAQGLHLDINGQEVYARMIGDYNAYNLLAAYGVGVLLDQDAAQTLAVLSELRGAEGRMETLFSPEKRITAVVDYAHTPDALEKIITTLQALRRPGNRVFTVVGCGGDRDRTKRPVMAEIAARLSDQAILTSDNPRTEDPEAILNEMEAGVRDKYAARYLRISDRRSAILAACRMAQAGDVVLVAGKGHEKYQEINGVRHPFDDVATVREALGIQNNG